MHVLNGHVWVLELESELITMTMMNDEQFY